MPAETTTFPGATIIKHALPGSPKTAPDMRITLFGMVQHHVHSSVLKIHSQFFRTFLDASDKLDLNGTWKSGFKYEWVSMIEDGDNWFLVAADGTDNQFNKPLPTRDDQLAFPHRPPNHHNFNPLPATEHNSKEHLFSAVTFNMLLKAMHYEPYKLQSVRQLTLLVAHADYYRALPVVSRSILNAIMAPSSAGVNEFMLSFHQKFQNILPAAIKLRNAALFRDSFILTLRDGENKLSGDRFLPNGMEQVGNGSTAAFLDLKELGIDELYKEKCKQIRKKITKAHASLVQFWLEAGGKEHAATGGEKQGFKESAEMVLQAILEVPENKDDRPRAQSRGLPAGYRRVREENFPSRKLELEVQDLLKNKLCLQPFAETGLGRFEKHFLCVSVSDNELPWDVKETEW